MTTNPVIVYGMVGLLIGALVLAFYFVRPRRGLGEVKPSDGLQADQADGPATAGGEPQPELPTFPSVPNPEPVAMPPMARDPWSSRTTEQGDQQARWNKP